MKRLLEILMGGGSSMWNALSSVVSSVSKLAFGVISVIAILIIVILWMIF